MYDTILFPTDGSEGAGEALEHAIDHAITYDADLHVLYVVEEKVTALEVGAGTVRRALEGEGERVVDDARDRARSAGVESVETTVAGGVPHRAILQYAEDTDVELIVMGTHGRTGIDRYLLGSVAEKVVRAAEPPVVTVRTEASGE